MPSKDPNLPVKYEKCGKIYCKIQYCLPPEDMYDGHALLLEKEL